WCASAPWRGHRGDQPAHLPPGGGAPVPRPRARGGHRPGGHLPQGPGPRTGGPLLALRDARTGELLGGGSFAGGSRPHVLLGPQAPLLLMVEGMTWEASAPASAALLGSKRESGARLHVLVSPGGRSFVLHRVAFSNHRLAPDKPATIQFPPGSHRDRERP